MIYCSDDSIAAHSVYHNIQIVVVQCLVFLFPVAIGSVKSWASGGYLLLVLLSIVAVWRKDDRSTYGNELLWPLFFFYVALLLSFVNVEEWYRAFKWLGKLSYFLFMIPTVLGLRKLPGNFIRPLSLGLLVAGFTAGGVAFYFQQILHHGRRIGSYNPIIFGDLAMLIAALIFFAGLSGIYRHRWLWLAPFSAASALYAAVASMTRGSWLVVPVLIFLMFFLLVKGRLFKHSINRRRFFCVAAMLLIFVMLSPLVFPDKIGSRVKRTHRSLVAFNTNGNLNTSTGVRFLLWDISFKIWQDNPLLGSGMGDFVIDQERMIKEKRTDLRKPQPHAHSIYFNFLSRTGLLGLLTMVVALLILPFRIFYRALPCAQNAEERFACLGGMSLIICYAVFGLTEAVFSRSAFIASFSFLLAAFLSTVSDRPPLEPENVKTDT